MLAVLICIVFFFFYTSMGVFTGFTIGVYCGYFVEKEDSRFPLPVAVIFWPIVGTIFYFVLLSHVCQYLSTLVLKKLKEKK